MSATAAAAKAPKIDPNMPVTLHLTDPLGGLVTVTVPIEQVLDVKRAMGARGYVGGEIPLGGYKRPYGEAANFDWSLIGAQPGTDSEGDEGVWCRGHFWKKRNYAAETTGQKKPAAIKYSRGALKTDPPEFIETSGELRMVPLILFRGNGRVNKSFLKPEASNGRAAAH